VEFETRPATATRGEATRRVTVGEIRAWLVVQLAELLGVSADEIDVRQPFRDYGLDSAEGVILAGDLEDWLGRELPATLAWDYPTIEALASHLAGEDEPAALAAADDEVTLRVLDEIEVLSEEETRHALDRERRLPEGESEGG
jgi:acyl carrier protein